MHDTPRPGRPSRYAATRGAAAWGLLFWLFAIALFVLPFLRDPDGETWDGEDWRRAEEDYTFEENVAYTEEVTELTVLDPLLAASEELFAWDSDLVETSGLFEAYRLESGRREYALHCAGCHGERGDGDGPAARHLSPRPRNYRSGVFKFTSTANGEKPLREDLMRVIRDGLPGSSMPSFRLITQEVRLDLVEYVRYLSIRGEFEELFWGLAYDDGELPDPQLVLDILLPQWDPAMQRKVFPGSAEPARDQASVDRGRELFLDASLTSCAACHGDTGLGDGPTARDYVDHWGYPIVPRDLSTGIFRAGQSAEGLYRAIATGIGGTPMGNFDGNLTSDQIWDLVHFVQWLGDPDFVEGGGQ